MSTQQHTMRRNVAVMLTTEKNPCRKLLHDVYALPALL
jgi:hypothetical protein